MPSQKCCAFWVSSNEETMRAQVLSDKAKGGEDSVPGNTFRSQHTSEANRPTRRGGGRHHTISGRQDYQWNPLNLLSTYFTLPTMSDTRGSHSLCLESWPCRSVQRKSTSYHV